jgi:hypothetical protein
MDYFITRTRAPEGYSVVDTPFGLSYGAHRPADEGFTYWRIANFLFPCCTMNPVGVLGEEMRLNYWLPIDDEHVMVWGMNAPSIPSSTEGGFYGKARSPRPERGRRPAVREYLPDTTDWLGRGRSAQNASNDYWLDREAQKRNEIYSGIPGNANPQDVAVQESMGPIYDRTNEHLGISDAMVIRMRRVLLHAVRALRDDGVAPDCLDKPQVFATRTGGVLLPTGVDWYAATENLRRPFVEHTQEGVKPLTVVGV